MKKNLKIVALMLIIFFTSSLYSQTDLLNLKKYWYYHYRLVNDFMAKGDCQGCSEPMNERSFKWKEDPSPQLSVIAKWGDQTIALGHYIAVLATEYKLLSDQNQPTDTTIKELYYAIKAFNRLDETAERIYAESKNLSHTPTSNDLNGFFIRDDVPSTFLANHPRLSTGVTSNKIITEVNSDYQASYELQQPTTTFTMSHDQVWYIFTGCALVRKFLHQGITYQNKPLNSYTGNTDIYNEALNIIDRIMNFITTNNINTDWTIVNPVDGTHSAIGWQIKELSYGAAEAACFIKNPTLSPSVSAFPVVHTCNDYHDQISYADAILWMNYGKGIGNLIAISPEDFKLQQLAAVGNSWYTAAVPIVPNPITLIKRLFDPKNILHPFKFIKELIQHPPIYPDNVTASELGVRALIRDNQHLPLLRQVLHGGTNLVSNSFYVNILNTAPCNGPRCYWNSNGECSTFEWSSSDRLHNAEERGGGSSQGEYCGLDYMLYYNLYHIVQGNTVPEINYMDRVITFPFPTTDNPPQGTATNPAIVEAFNSITAANVVNSNSNVTYRAGNEVVLRPGFIAKAGSNFRAYVDPFQCATNGGYEILAQSNDPNKNSYSKSVADNSVAFNGPTTYIRYPKSAMRTNKYNDYNETAKNDNNSLENTISSKPIKTQNISDTFTTVSGILIIPNPNNGIFQVMITHNNQSIGVKELKVYDIMGKMVWATSNSENAVFNIDISNYSPGVYYVRSVNELGEIETQKLIKQ